MKLSKIIFFTALGLILNATCLQGASELSKKSETSTSEVQRLAPPGMYEAQPGESEIFTAIRTRPFAEVQKLIESNPNVLIEQSPSKDTPLNLAVGTMNDKLVDFILQSPLLPTFINTKGGYYGVTPLCQAAHNLQYYQDKMKYGQEKEEIDIARISRYEKIIASLLNAGADQTLCSQGAQVAIEPILKELHTRAKTIVEEAVKEVIGGGVGPAKITRQYAIGLTPAEAAQEAAEAKAAEDRKTEAAILSAEFANAPRSATSSSGATSLSDDDEESIMNQPD